MAFRKAKVEVMTSFDIEQNPGLIAVQEEAAREQREQAADAQALPALGAQSRQAHAAEQDLNIKIVLGKATVEDLARVRALREDADREIAVVRHRMVERQARIDSRVSVLEQLRAELRKDRRVRAIAAARPIVERQARRFREAAEDNELLLRIDAESEDALNLPDFPRGDVEFRNDQNGVIGRFINNAKIFKWDDYRA